MNEHVSRSKPSFLVFNYKNRLLGKISLIASPLLFFISEVLHPRSETDTAKELLAVSNNFTKWYISHILAYFAIIFLVFAILHLINYIDSKHTSLYYIGFIFTTIGIVSVSGYTAFDLIVWQMGSNGPSEAMISLYDRIIQAQGFSLPFMIIGPLCLVIGIALVALSLYLSFKIKRWKSIFVLIGILLYGLAGPLIPIENGHLIVIFGAALMFIGLGSINLEQSDNTKEE